MSALALSTSPIVKAAVDVCDEARLELIIEAADLAGSYARSAAEAAFRDDRHELGVHLRQLRLATIAALKTYNELAPAAGEKAEAA
jgi:hypothetical protein